jgi:uncharacterized protein (UPF0276 family)
VLDKANLHSNGNPVQPLGIGFPYFAALPADLYRCDLVAFVEITPETICRQRGTGKTTEFEIVPDLFATARETCVGLPTVVHGVELSIGSAHGCNHAYLEMLDRFQQQWPFLWHSEHLGFQTIAGDDDTSLEIGVPLPMPATVEAVELVAERSANIQQRYGVPFLLENPAYYFRDLPTDPEIGNESGFLQAVTKKSGCYLLLDLHNLYCNAVNLHFEAREMINRLPLDRVIEIHVAGGSWRDGFWMDAHDGRVPEPVWQLLEYVLPNTPNVAGVVFELLEEHALRLGPPAIEEELRRAWQIWDGKKSSHEKAQTAQT